MCIDSDGKIFYTGPYDKESGNGYFVQLDDRTEAFFPKDQCRKIAA
ncbi:MAG TPA: hypothetical protein VKB81_19405 [Nitrospira sp.]|nr:hypothetical protein [Nitrospira sp.]